MKIQKLIVPVLALSVITIIYFTYFRQSGLGSFDDFDTNNNGNKTIVVQVVKEKAPKEDQANRVVTFYGVDKKGLEVLIQAPLPLPLPFESLNKIELKGHRHPDHFHAIEVKSIK